MRSESTNEKKGRPRLAWDGVIDEIRQKTELEKTEAKTSTGTKKMWPNCL